MKVLVACEFSGTVRDEFLALGHEAMSCDLLPSETNGPHYKGDVRDLLLCGRWDLMIAFPPCTHIAASGARWFKYKKNEQTEAIFFVEMLWESDIPRVCIENPVGVLSTRSKLGKPTQYIQPWQFGHGETKKTGLWLRNIPPLIPTNIVAGRDDRVLKMSPGPDRWKNRSRTYVGIARAMARQWGG